MTSVRQYLCLPIPLECLHHEAVTVTVTVAEAEIWVVECERVTVMMMMTTIVRMVVVLVAGETTWRTVTVRATPACNWLECAPE